MLTFALAIKQRCFGTLADRLGNGLQNRVEQFDSARYLDILFKASFHMGGCFFCAFHPACAHILFLRPRFCLHAYVFPASALWAYTSARKPFDRWHLHSGQADGVSQGLTQNGH